jgi:hypothetical protein
MKSTEVYRLLRDEVGPWSKEKGFTRGKTMLSWCRPSNGMHVVFWFQISRDGWDDYAGSQFTVEFQLSREPEVGVPSVRRQRFTAFIDDNSRDELRRIQNSIIEALPRPPSNHPTLQMPEAVRKWYLKKFDLVTEPYLPRDDVWYRYHTDIQIQNWGRFFLKHLPDCIRQTEQWS